MMTNIENKEVNHCDEIFVNEISIGTLSASYTDGEPDKLIAIHGSNGTVEIAINQANAADRFKVFPCVKILKKVPDNKVSK